MAKHTILTIDRCSGSFLSLPTGRCFPPNPSITQVFPCLEVPSASSIGVILVFNFSFVSFYINCIVPLFPYFLPPLPMYLGTGQLTFSEVVSCTILFFFFSSSFFLFPRSIDLLDLQIELRTKPSDHQCSKNPSRFWHQSLWDYSW